jgi:hypothetical protein
MTGFIASSLYKLPPFTHGIGDFNKVRLSDEAIEYIKNEILIKIPEWYRLTMRYGFLLIIIFLVMFNLIFTIPVSFYSFFMVLSLYGYYFLKKIYQKPFTVITPDIICNNPIFSFSGTTQRFNKILTEKHKINIKEETLKIYANKKIIKAVRSEAINQIEIKHRRVVYLIGMVLLLLTTYYRYN